MNTFIYCLQLLSEPDQYFYHSAFQRHINDLGRFKDSKEYRFNEELAHNYIMWIERLSHYKGELAGKNIELEKWQKAVIGILSGWEKLNSKGEWVRRFSTALILSLERTENLSLLLLSAW